MKLEQAKKLFDFSGKTAVVTGGAGILGGEIACALAECGAQVAILDLNTEPVGRLEERVKHSAGKLMAVKTNVLDGASLAQALETVLSTFGKVDILINAAGGNKPQATTNPQTFFNLPQEALRFVFDLNILGTILPSQVFGKHMAERLQEARL